MSSLRCFLAACVAALPVVSAAQDIGPEPSLILGLAAPSVATAAAPVEVSFQSAYADPVLREALRIEDPDMFAGMLAAGLLDPLPEGLPTAIQQELQRMGCYVLPVDGDFGPGSREAVVRYFEETGAPAPPLVPSVDLFRAIISAAPVTCPPPVATTTQPTPTPTQDPRPIVVQEPDPPPDPPREINLLRPTIGGRG